MGDQSVFGTHTTLKLLLNIDEDSVLIHVLLDLRSLSDTIECEFIIKPFFKTGWLTWFWIYQRENFQQTWHLLCGSTRGLSWSSVILFSIYMQMTQLYICICCCYRVLQIEIQPSLQQQKSDNLGKLIEIYWKFPAKAEKILVMHPKAITNSLFFLKKIIPL